jgi:hypothetical protein
MPDNRKKPITSKCCREVVTNKIQTQKKTIKKTMHKTQTTNIKITKPIM